jgi:hypothetical protein
MPSLEEDQRLALGENRRPYLKKKKKNLKQKRAGGVAQVIEHLPSKPKTLSSTPGTAMFPSPCGSGKNCT